MKRGFTLVELLTVLVLLGLLSLIVVPVIDKIIKQNRNNLYQIQVNNIEESARNWAAKNTFSLPTENNSINITLCDLAKAGFLEPDIKNPKTEEAFYQDSYVIIAHSNSGFTYSYQEDSGIGMRCE